MEMGRRGRNDEIPLTEPVPAAEHLATGCEAQEEGDLVWITFYSERRRERVIVARVAIPRAQFRGVAQALWHLAERGDGTMQ